MLTHSMTHCAAQADEADITPYVDRVHDAALRHALGYGVAFLHETQQPAEQDVAKLLFSSGAVQVRRGGLL